MNGLGTKLEQMKMDQRNNETLNKVLQFVSDGVLVLLAFLCVNKGFLMIRNPLMMSLNQRSQALEDIHRSHPGVTKCQTHARTSLRWPGMSRAIETMVSQFQICHKEPNT